ncbi:MAG: acetyltransferase [Candidatus Aminicenantes bacterium]|nr:acetyltransferase [Candidatus Aminicenantes bacterium]
MYEAVVIGGGGHARVVLCVLKKIGIYRIIGYTDNVDRGKLLGVEYLGDDHVLDVVKQKYPECAVVLGLGQLTMSDVEKRAHIRSLLERWKFTMPPVKSPDAVINREVELGEGTVVLDGAVINSGTCIGKDAIINTNATVEHDCRLGDAVHVACGAVLSGGVRVGSRTLVGAGATVVHGVAIGEDCIIGAGAVVAENCLDPGTYVGVPARKIVK